MDMGSLRAELQLPHHFIIGDYADDLDDDIMILGSTPQVPLLKIADSKEAGGFLSSDATQMPSFAKHSDGHACMLDISVDGCCAAFNRRSCRHKQMARH